MYANYTKNSEKIYVGRPTRFEERFVNMAFEIMCLGATIQKLAEVFQVHRDTIYEWMKVHPEFSEAIQRGRDEFDSEHVEKALKKKCLGFRYIEKSCVLNSNGIVIGIKQIKKYVPPSDVSIKFWLSNRNPRRWSLHSDIITESKIYYNKKEIDEMMMNEKQQY